MKVISVLAFVAAGILTGVTFSGLLAVHKEKELPNGYTRQCAILGALVAVVAKILFMPWFFVILSLVLILAQSKTSHKAWTAIAFTVMVGMFMSIAKRWDVTGPQFWQLMLLLLPATVLVINKDRLHRAKKFLLKLEGIGSLNLFLIIVVAMVIAIAVFI